VSGNYDGEIGIMAKYLLLKNWFCVILINYPVHYVTEQLASIQDFKSLLPTGMIYYLYYLPPISTTN
jgi:hypothetical protein